jgi:hypothetical protein
MKRNNTNSRGEDIRKQTTMRNMGDQGRAAVVPIIAEAAAGGNAGPAMHEDNSPVARAAAVTADDRPADHFVEAPGDPRDFFLSLKRLNFNRSARSLFD